MKMRCFFALLVGCLFVSHAAAEAVKFESVEGGFSLDYPAAWQEKPGVNASILVMFMSPLDGASDTFAENVNVVLKDLPPKVAGNMNVDQMVDHVKPIVLKQMSGTELSDEKATVGGQPARKLTLDAQIMGKPCRLSQWYVMNGDRMYIVSYAGRADSPAALNDAAAGIVASMKFTAAATRPTSAPATLPTK